ncbi:nuclear transport factor 2 family protein [Pseudonocardia zijingensis]|jgi:ketosteroid isomerase-like protein|uniref:Nuclear transport factor 2 family protein n=1 Tax=Pseudonocardia zijingensis TaxID=153376 RepID=A0ABN1N6Z3_9PSEU
MTDHATTDATAAHNVTALRTGYAAFASRDVPVVLALLDPDVRWVEAAGGPFAGTYVGPEDVSQGVFGRLAAEWAEFHVEPEEYIASGDAVAVVGTYRGTYRSTGKAVTARFVHVYHFRQGRIVRHESVGDTAMLNSVLA